MIRVRLPGPNEYERYLAHPCSYPGCQEKTSERKPFCSDHVLEHSYAAKIRAEVEAAESERVRVGSYGSREVDPFGANAGDVLAQLFAGAKTVAELAYRLQWPKRVVRFFLIALEREDFLVRMPIGHKGNPGAQLMIDPAERPDRART